MISYKDWTNYILRLIKYNNTYLYLTLEGI